MVTRSGLPQNFVISPATELVDDDTFKNIAKWTSTKTVASDTVNFISGSNAIKFAETTPGSNGVIDLGASGEFLPIFYVQGGTWITYDVYLPDASAVQYIKFFVSGHATSWNYADALYSTCNCAYLVDGWNHVRVQVRTMSVNGTCSVAVAMKKIRFQIYSNTGKSAVVTVDNLRFNQMSIPQIMLTFDDNHASQYSVAYPYMKAKGLAGTIMSNSGNIGTANHMTLAQCQEMYADGWCFANHTTGHVDLSTASDSTITSQIVGMQEYLIENGMPRGAYVGAYPFNNHNQHAEDMCASLGMLAMRCGPSQGYASQQVPSHMLAYPYDLMKLGTSFICDVTIVGSTLANAMIAVDNALKNNATLVIMLHNFLETPTLSGEWTIADFQALIDYIVTKNIRCVTMDEWYQGLTNPRYRSLPLTRA